MGSIKGGSCREDCIWGFGDLGFDGLVFEGDGVVVFGWLGGGGVEMWFWGLNGEVVR